MPNKIDLTGKRFGKWLVISEQKERVNNRICWYCVCDCGTKRGVMGGDLQSGKSLNCGVCGGKGKIGDLTRTHGKYKHPIYRIWSGIISRCYEPSHIGYQHYGANGVTVCDDWRYNFQAFYDWAVANNWKKGLEIDKDIKYKEKYGISPGKIYSSEMCSIVTKSQNLRSKTSNRVIIYNGESKTLVEWCELLNIPYYRTLSRLRSGHSLEWCIENKDSVAGKYQSGRKGIPLKKTTFIHDGKEYTISEIAEKFGLNRSTLKSRLYNGKDLETALFKPIGNNAGHKQ